TAKQERVGLGDLKLYLIDKIIL
ncbi:MAG: hypothetical protein UU61_C0025G0011, partial [Parcubacteria group bacterium GW2011_GWB1_41_4]